MGKEFFLPDPLVIRYLINVKRRQFYSKKGLKVLLSLNQRLLRYHTHLVLIILEIFKNQIILKIIYFLIFFLIKKKTIY